ncbi:protein of unknown function [Beijerinckiaceae bacterium RH AL1]|nr:hypothetical protein [Beijerinckiaceae bacterium]VVB47907.1 protein of unknown function [Beijerinckiaceae bacterium RH CH11]VVB47984.1 protein of unknown function [Beijerinckiaceae bacterium RH AL8]VVC56125.1 protein of unknown function [Beijerinckiaceae bacterium RH AL1]
MAHDTILDYRQLQDRAAAKLAAHRERMAKARTTPQQQAYDAKLLQELRANKAAADLNRALFDYSAAAEKV